MTNKTSAHDRKWLGLFAVLAATIMNLLDSTVATVAAPAIRADLGGSYASLQWIAASYTLALAVGLLTGGRLGDMFGRRRMLFIGIVGFVVASLLCAGAWSPESLIAARVLQGLFGAVMIPQGFGLIRDMFPPHEIGKAFGAFGPVIGLATILGPIVAGLLVDADLFGTGWRAVFAINLPIGAFALLAGVRALPAGITPDGRTLKLDVGGALLAGTGMLMLVYPLVQGRELGWPAWSLALLAGAVVVLGIFVVTQLRRKRSGRTPLVELSVFTKRSYTSGVIFVVAFFAAIVGFSLAVGLLLQLGMGFSPLRASLTMASWAVGAFLGTGFAAATMAKLGRRVLHVGLTVIAVGLGWLYLVLDAKGTAFDGGDLVAPLLVFGLGMGMIFVPLFDVIMGEVADHEVGSASGMLESIQQLAASLGVAALGTVFFGIVGTRFEAAVFVDAARVVTLATIGLVAVAFALGFLLPRKARVHAPAAEVQAVSPEVVREAVAA